MAASRSKRPPQSWKKDGSLPWALPIVLAVLLVSAWGALFYGNARLSGQIAAVQAYTQDPANLAALAQVQADRTAAENYQAAAAEAGRAVDILNSTLQPDEALLRRADGAAADAISLPAYDYGPTRTTLTYSCSRCRLSEHSDFISRMFATGDYMTIGYGGYTQAPGEGGYVFTITCTVKGRSKCTSFPSGKKCFLFVLALVAVVAGGFFAAAEPRAGAAACPSGAAGAGAARPGLHAGRAGKRRRGPGPA